MQRRRRYRKPAAAATVTANPVFRLLEKELREVQLHPIIGCSARPAPPPPRRPPPPAPQSSSVAMHVEDPIFSRLLHRILSDSFDLNEHPPAPAAPTGIRLRPSLIKTLSAEEQENLRLERASHAHFLQHLVISAIFDDK